MKDTDISRFRKPASMIRQLLKHSLGSFLIYLCIGVLGGYVLPPIEAQDSGGEVSRFQPKQQLATPTIIQQPLDRIVPEGTILWLTVDVEHSSSVTYQWQKGRTNLDGFGTTSSLYLGRATPDLNGEYRVLIGYDGGELVSRVARVIVQPEGESKTNTSFYPLLTEKGAKTSYEVPSGFDGDTVVSTEENVSVDGDPVLAYTDTRGTNLKIGSFIIPREDYLVSSTYDYGRTDGGMNYYGFKVVASTRNSDPFLSEFFDKDQIFSVTPVHGFPAKRETIDGELRSEPYFFYPEVVELGKIYEKTNSVTEEGVQYDNEVQFPNGNIDFTHMDSRSERTETMRVVYLLDSIKDASPSSKDIYADLLDDETMTALVVVTEHNETYRKDDSVMYFEDGSTFPMERVYQNGLVQSTSVEWRVKGIGLVRVVSLQGLYMDEILEQRFFDIELNNNMIIGGTFDQWLYRRFGQFDIDVPESTRIGGNTEPPFIGLNKLDTDVEVHDGLVSLFGFDEVVLEPDQAPVLSGGEDLLVTEPTTVEWQFRANDPDGRQEIEYRVWRTAGLDARIDRVTGEFSLNIGSNIPDGEYTVTVRAKEVGPYSLATFKSLTVNVQMGNTGELVPWSIHNPGFETLESISAPSDNRIPSKAGEWKGLLVGISDEPSGIDFPEGNRALRLFAEPPQAEEGARYYDSDVFQIIDFRSTRDEIDTGTVVLDFEVLANQIVAPGAEIPAEFYVDLMGYSGQPSDLIRGNFSENSTVRWNLNLTPDTDSSTWESMAAELPLPPETDCLAIRLGSSVEISETQSLDQLGQYYFDNVQISLKTLEESFAQLTSQNQDIQWTTGPHRVWHVDTSSDTANGPYLKPTSILDGDSATVQAEIQGPGTLSFEWQYLARSFSQVALMVHMDGSLIARQDEPDDWLSQSIDIPVGKHTVQWTVSLPGSDFPFWRSGTAAIRSIQFSRNTDFPVVAIIEDIVAQAGQTVRFVADVTGGDVLSYQWYKDGVAIPGAIGTSLALPDVKESDAGKYSIRVESGGQVIESNSASLTVLTTEPQTPEPPVITTHPSDQSVFQGEDVMLSVSAQSMEQENYQWYFDGAELTGETASSLELLDVKLDQAGEYHVKVSNSGGSVLSRSAVLTVTPITVDPPLITPENGMVLIPNDGPVGIGKDHSNLVPVTIDAFHMDIHEVTKELWDTVRNWGLSNGYEDLVEGLAGWEGDEKHPVTKVNLFDAMKWCNARSEMNGLQPAYYLDAEKTEVYRVGNRLFVHLNSQSGYRLPSEPEWEKAARGNRYADAQKTKGYKYPWGTDSISESLANYNDSQGTTIAVGSFPSNDYGLYDMSGNVWEWCVDITASGSTMERNYRGGAFTEAAEQCTVISTPHGDNAPGRTNAGGVIGFRTVLPGNQTPPDDESDLSSIVRSIERDRITLVVNPAENVLAVAIEETLPQGFSATNISGEGVWDSRNEKVKWGPYFDNQSRTFTYNLTPPSGYAGSVDLIGYASLDGVDIWTEGDTSVVFEIVPEASEVQRTIQKSGDVVNISLSIKPTSGTVAYAVEESLPTGFSGSSISEGGVQDAVNHKIKWGPFFDANPRTLTYALVTPDGFSGAVTFSGLASFDGRDIPVGGERSIEIDSPTQTGPMIVSQPIGGEVALGESFALSVTVEGNVQGYQWFKDGVAVPGATSSSFTIPVIGLEDAGSYSVSISDGVQEILSEAAMVQVSGPVENAPPTIALIGDALLELSQGTTYTEPGVSATDPEDGDLTDQVVIDGQVNASVPGVYTLRYSVSDQQGLSVSASRTVLVLASEISILTGPLINETNGNKYYLLSAASWTESEAFARELGGHLTTIRNTDEQEWIWETFSAFGGEERSLWIGLNDQDQEGSYQWASGEAVDFTHWLDGQPDDNPSSGGEDYVHIIRRGNAFNAAPGFWNDLADTDAVFDQFSPLHGVVEVVPVIITPPADSDAVLVSLLSPTTEKPFYRLAWESQVGASYVIETVDQLGQAWSLAEPQPVVAVSDVTEWALEVSGQSRFFRVRSASADVERPGEGAIQVVLEPFPKDGAFAIPRLAPISVELPEAQLIDTDSIRINVGSLGTFGVEDVPVQYDQGTLTFDPSLAGALGDPEALVAANVFYSDQEGNQYTYDWSFRLQKQTILKGDVFVLGSPQAQFQGQSLNPRQLAIYEQLGVTPSAFAIRQQTGNAPWSLDEVKEDSLIFSYEGDTPPNFQVGQFLANLTPAKKEEIFYRKVVVVLKDVPEKQKVSVFTEDVGLLEIFVQASMLSHPVGLPALAYQILQDGLLVNASQSYLLETPIADTWSPVEGVDLTLSGNISIEPQLTLSLDVQGSAVEDFYFRQGGTLKTELGASLKVTESHDWEERTKEPLYAADRVFYLGQVGVVPIWLDLEFEVNAEAEARYEVTGEISTGIEKTYDYWSELVYSTRNPSLNGLFASPPSAQMVVKPLEVTIDGHTEAAVRLVPELTMELESLFGVRVDLTPEVGLVGDVRFADRQMESASVELYGRIDLNAGLSIEGVEDDLLPQIEPIELVYFPWRFDYEGASISIIDQPQSQSVVAGSTVELSVEVSNDTGIAYQWFYNDEPILGENGSTLVIDDFDADSDEGVYFVSVEKGGSTVVSDQAVVALKKPSLEFVEVPETMKVEEGESVHLEVVTNDPDNPTILYEWSRDGETLPINENRLVLESISSEDEGFYAVIVTRGDEQIATFFRIRIRVVKFGEDFTIGDPALSMIAIPAGTFSIGSPENEEVPLFSFDEKPQTLVTISEPFWLAETEVTQDQWETFMRTNPSNFKGGDLPVDGVTKDLIRVYCRLLNDRERAAGRLPSGYQYDLPTEAQWEYACRAGTTSRYSFGDSEAQLGLYAWYKENSEFTTSPVGLKLPNSWGLHDMHGNVREWCYESFVDGIYPGGSVTDSKFLVGSAKTIARGGDWDSPAEYCRSASRSRLNDKIYRLGMGFRVALVPVSN